MKQIVAAGLGGQGVLSTGLIIAKIAMDEGKKVTWMPSYGAEMRGGAVDCNIKISDDDIASPFVKEIDILVAFSKSAIEKYQGQMKPGGTIIVNSSMVSDIEYRNDVNVAKIDANEIAIKLQNPKGANVIVLGAMIKSTDLFGKDEFLNGINRFFADKGIVNDKNTESYLQGYDLVQQ